MRPQTAVQDKSQETEYPTSYREVKIGRTVYCVTSVFTGEKELGPTLERLAVRRVLDEMDAAAKNILRNG